MTSLSSLLFQLFLLVLAYGAVKIVIQIVNQRKCPEDEILRNVVLGITKKNSETAEKVIRHLGICEKCQERVREIGEE